MYQYLEEELDQLRTRIIKMGSLVEEQIELAFKALYEQNLELANIVIDRDDKVDKYDVKIDKQCQRIFALTQPVAIDLRLIMSAMNINNDLERMGDIAVNIAERVMNFISYQDLLERIELPDMTKKVQSIVKGAIDSFVNNDAEMAADIIKLDRVIDKAYEETFDKLIHEMSENKELIKPCSHAITLLKNIERLADHSTNIAEDVIFLVDAKIIKHRKSQDKDDDAPIS
ncbi:MAG: phosphate signaling complex protein PhoU [Bacteroidetes bacterium]|nr:phosphate signaling complex protein PhoU [Bacteroidota bacterium]MBX7046585.1 phosphate signaling complex protein PhoU [Ignavibacteria bacterium]